MNYRKGIIKDTDIPGVVQFRECDLINVDLEIVPLLNKRLYGNFKGKGYFLSVNYNWQIIKDDEGHLVLVPTKKEN